MPFADTQARAATLERYASSHENNYDFLRFALATSVVFGHGFHAVNRTGKFYEPLLGPTRGQEQLGHLAVFGFFTISGWLVTASWERSSGFVDFLRKRSLRIYPGFILCYLVCLFLVAPTSGLSWAEYTAQFNGGRFLAKMLLLRGFGGYYAFPFNGQHMLNTSLWSIPIEFGCYLMVAAFAIFGAFRRRAIFVVTALAYASVLFGALRELPGFDAMPAFVQRAVLHIDGLMGYRIQVCFFLMGATLYLLKDRVPFSGKLAAVALVASVIAARLPPLFDLVLPLCLPYLVFFFVYHPRIDLRRFGRRADLSYGIYLFGWPLQQIFARMFPSASGLTLFFIVMPALCAVAFASWTFVEEPCLRLKRARAPITPEPAVN